MAAKVAYEDQQLPNGNSKSCPNRLVRNASKRINLLYRFLNIGR